MSDPRRFGAIINERRLELGYSLGQFANRVGATAAQVRSWERGEEVPDDETVGRIAGELDLPGSDLRTPLSAPTRGRRAAGTDVPEPTAVVMSPVFSDSGDTSSAGDRPTGGAPGSTSKGDARPVGVAPPTPGSDDGHDLGGADLDDAAAREDILDQPTEAVPLVPPPPPERRREADPAPALPVAAVLAPPRPEPSAPPVAGPPGPAVIDPVDEGLFAGWNRALGIIFDPDRPYLFWVRTVLTVIVMLVFLRVLAWAVPAFFDVLSDILDTIESSDPPDTDFPAIPGLPEGIPTTLPTG